MSASGEPDRPGDDRVDQAPEAWVELRDELRQLHAQLEYLALMLRVQRPPG